MNTIENAYLAVELHAKPVEPVRRVFLDHLKSQNIDVEIPSRGVHVSLCYSMGQTCKDQLEHLAKILASECMEMRVTGAQLLRGQTSPYDYVTLTLEGCASFARAKAYVEDALPTRNFPGGFKVHVSLLQVPKGALDDVDFDYVNSYLEDLAKDVCGGIRLAGECVRVFDQSRCCRIQCQLPRLAS